MRRIPTEVTCVGLRIEYQDKPVKRPNTTTASACLSSLLKKGTGTSRPSLFLWFQTRRIGARPLFQQAVRRLAGCLILLSCVSCTAGEEEQTRMTTDKPTQNPSTAMQQDKAPDVAKAPQAADAGQKPQTETATFGAGCFWCVEAVFQLLDGVVSVESGYSGGSEADADYKKVCTGTTGHAEVCQVSFDPKKITFDELLEVFWKTHDPTTLNRQGADFGSQYRSVVFYHSDSQKETAARYKKKLDDAGAFLAPIVTEISPFTAFYPAEDYHRNYYRNNPEQSYCARVIGPKVDKFNKVFQDKLRAQEK